MRYRKKPVEVDVFRWNGEALTLAETPDWFDEKIKEGFIWESLEKPVLKIDTLEGIMEASAGDFIIKGVDNEVYPCKPHIFSQTYEEVNAAQVPGSRQEVAQRLHQEI